MGETALWTGMPWNEKPPEATQDGGSSLLRRDTHKTKAVASEKALEKAELKRRKRQRRSVKLVEAYPATRSPYFPHCTAACPCFVLCRSAHVVASMVSGAAQAGLLNPWDRALYLSVKTHSRFLSSSNWTAPYHGFTQTIAQRTLSGGLYFLLQGEIMHALRPVLAGARTESSNAKLQFGVGLVAGCLNGAILNGLAVVKYHAWGKEGQTFVGSARHLYAKGGVRPFFKGMAVTAGRDTVFGCIYEVMRGQLKRQASIRRGEEAPGSVSFMIDLVSAGTGTVLSGPLNYARNIIYSAPPHTPPPSLLKSLQRYVPAPPGLIQEMLMCAGLGIRTPVHT